MSRTAPTEAEERFFALVAERVPGALDWYHVDDNGAPWMIASVDVSDGGVVVTTWRCDYDGESLLGGRSPAALNWDEGVKALDAGIDVDGLDGIRAATSTPEAAAKLASEWFLERLADRG